MPFGYAERPTHYSNSFDRARYEVPGHRFADLSEHGFGAALLSESKYGFSCFGGDLKLTLLRSPKSPDPEADMGAHEFSYALMPHAGGWREGGVLREAALFNSPLRWTTDGPASSFATVDGDLVLETIKRAERSDALVLRLYEPYGGRGESRVALAEPFTSVRRTNLLEEGGDEVAIEDGVIVVPYRPHEVITLVVE